MYTNIIHITKITTIQNHPKKDTKGDNYKKLDDIKKDNLKSKDNLKDEGTLKGFFLVRIIVQVNKITRRQRSELTI